MNIVYKAAPLQVIQQVNDKLGFPAEFISFLAKQNDAKLFSGKLNILGVVEAGQLLNRQDPYSLPPFDIEPENEFWRNDRERS